jgi:hypothetical protein
MTVTVSSRGYAAGTWLSDADLWLRPRADWPRHGTFEIVIANRWRQFRTLPGTPLAMPAMWIKGQPARWAPARIGRVLYRASTWITQDPATGYRWPILVFQQVRQTATAHIRVAAFVRWAVKHARLPSGWWLGDVAYGTELWSGGRGLTDSMTVTWPGLPVLGGRP